MRARECVVFPRRDSETHQPYMPTERVYGRERKTVDAELALPIIGDRTARLEPIDIHMCESVADLPTTRQFSWSRKCGDASQAACTQRCRRLARKRDELRRGQTRVCPVSSGCSRLVSER